MARSDKAAAVAELTGEFRNSNGAVLTEYRGLTVKQLQELRRALGANATYAVVKNTLTRIAAKEAGVDSFDDLLTGPSAIAFIKGDAVETAKSLRDFARANSPLVIKGGILDGSPLTTDEIARIADLESREVLLAKLAGALLASLQNAVFLFNAPLSQAARVAGALRAKAELDPSILRGGPGEAVPVSGPESDSTPDDAANISTDISSDAPADGADDASQQASAPTDVPAAAAPADVPETDDTNTDTDIATAAPSDAADADSPETTTG